MRNFRVSGGHMIGVELRRVGWFMSPGAYFVVDGQFGSTGKGALAAVLAASGLGNISLFTTNAGPNSGHTAVIGPRDHSLTIVTKQLPVGACVTRAAGQVSNVLMNAGAILDLNTLYYEMNKYDVHDVVVHPCAAVVLPKHVEQETSNGAARVAGTGKGTGAALADKVNREGNIAKFHVEPERLSTSFMNASTFNMAAACKEHVVMVETPQGFSLGLNEPRFAPHTTSRECSVLQAMSDARIPVSARRKVAMSVRTFPIRVGNTSIGESGDCYPDQHEITWEELGVQPELTTVTKRVRRVFTWSDEQFVEALLVNEPDLLFVSFMDYLPENERAPFLERVINLYEAVMGKRLEALLCGYGPHIDDVVIYKW